MIQGAVQRLSKCEGINKRGNLLEKEEHLQRLGLQNKSIKIDKLQLLDLVTKVLIIHYKGGSSTFHLYVLALYLVVVCGGLNVHLQATQTSKQLLKTIVVTLRPISLFELAAHVRGRGYDISIVSGEMRGETNIL